MGLLCIPRASARAAQNTHDFDQIVKSVFVFQRKIRPHFATSPSNIVGLFILPY